jgi:hypothetical protein
VEQWRDERQNRRFLSDVQAATLKKCKRFHFSNTDKMTSLKSPVGGVTPTRPGERVLPAGGPIFTLCTLMLKLEQAQTTPLGGFVPYREEHWKRITKGTPFE